MNSKKAVIDIGTNTFHLLIAEIDENNRIKIIHKNTIPVKLGEGGVNKGYIADAAYQRGIAALVTYRKELNEHGLSSVKATATAAVRDASNGEAFIAEALEKAAIQIDIIDGMKEAGYIYNGAKAAGVLNGETALIMDIGGGSTEFIICNQDEIFWKNSYTLGAARLLADFHEGEDAISEEVLSQMHQHFENKLKELSIAIQKHQPKKLIGTAGSFDSLAEMTSLKTQKPFDPNTMKRYDFEFDDLDGLLKSIIRSNHEQREQMEGLIPLRVDMILMASILTQYIIQISGIKEVTTCTYSLKEGLLMSDF